MTEWTITAAELAELAADLIDGDAAAAERIGVERSTLSRWRRERIIKATRLGRGHVYAPAEVERVRRLYAEERNALRNPHLAATN